MAKQNNSLTELQALEGIYEHLSTIDDLAKEVGTISTRLRKIEEQLKEPVNITDPILAQDLTRDTCIYGALAKSMEACKEMKSQIKELNGISADVKHLVDDINLIRNIQTEMRSEIMNRINETSTDFYSQNRKIVVLLMLILFCIISIIIFEMLY
jgi:predicted ATP-grasp superfamily ATP-dependent carboligase